jgi:hypothetical protein
MNIRRMLYRGMIRLLEQLTVSRPFSSCHSARLSVAPLPESNRQCDLITVAFNNVETIERQIHFVRKYFMKEGEYNYIVADNSTNPAIQREIEALCSDTIAYVRLPKNYLTQTRGGSYSHGTALNWLYRHVVRKRQPCYFGFVDHDLLPIRPADPVENLCRQPLYGLVKERGSWWYLWAGFCFFRFDFVKHRKVDFLPAKPKDIYLDTGGSNWYSIYSQVDRESLPWASYAYELVGGAEEREDNWADSMVEYIDGAWLHTMDASNWYGVAADKLQLKEDAVRAILKDYL